MDEHLRTELLGLNRDLVAHGEFVGLKDELGAHSNIGRVLLRGAVYDEDIVPRLKQLVDRRVRSRDGLVDNKGLDVRIIR